MHTREYSDETARVIDEEVERILREQEDRARQILTDYRAALDLVAKALLEEETISGAQVIDLARVGGPDARAAVDSTRPGAVEAPTALREAIDPTPRRSDYPG